MYTWKQNDDDFYEKELIRKIANHETRIKISKVNRKKLENINNDLEKYYRAKRLISDVIDETAGLIKEEDYYLSKKKEDALRNIKTAILEASTIISDTHDYRLECDGKTACLVNEKGCLLEDTEGSGYKGMVSCLIRALILNSTDYLQFLILDEPLATLSEDNSTPMGNKLEYFTKDMLIVIIEQKDTIFSDIDNYKTYLIKKTEGVSRIISEKR